MSSHHSPDHFFCRTERTMANNTNMSSFPTPLRRSLNNEKVNVPSGEEILFLAGSGNMKLAEDIVGRLGTSLGKVTVKKFADGETYIQVDEVVRGRDVYLIQPTAGVLPATGELSVYLFLRPGFPGRFGLTFRVDGLFSQVRSFFLLQKRKRTGFRSMGSKRGPTPSQCSSSEQVLRRIEYLGRTRV